MVIVIMSSMIHFDGALLVMMSSMVILMVHLSQCQV